MKSLELSWFLKAYPTLFFRVWKEGFEYCVIGIFSEVPESSDREIYFLIEKFN